MEIDKILWDVIQVLSIAKHNQHHRAGHLSSITCAILSAIVGHHSLSFIRLNVAVRSSRSCSVGPDK